MENEIIKIQPQITNRIFTIRGEHVLIDRDLAELYQVETRVLNQAVKRNITRFPESFRFQLTDKETEDLLSKTDRYGYKGNSRSQFVILNKGQGKNIKYLPYASFTEQGVAMLSAVLRSEIAVQVSIQIMNAFVQMRKLIGQETVQNLRFSNIENKLVEHDQKFNQLFAALDKNELPQKGIFYDGQVFDAYTFIADLIRKATKSLILIDNYIDDSVFTLLNKRQQGVKCVCYTQTITKNLSLDLDKHNHQYPVIEVKEFKSVHDRFLIIDESELYHIGASLKDLGKKWFAFSKLNWDVQDVIRRIEG